MKSRKSGRNAGRHESLLNSRWVKLDEALLLAQDSRYWLTEVEQTYLKGCVALRNREQRERERGRKITLTSAIAVMVTIMALLVGWNISSTKSANEKATQVVIAQTAQAKAEELKNIALARQLAAQAQSVFGLSDEQLTLSGLLAAQSMKISPVSKSSEILAKNEHHSFCNLDFH